MRNPPQQQHHNGSPALSPTTGHQLQVPLTPPVDQLFRKFSPLNDNGSNQQPIFNPARRRSPPPLPPITTTSQRPLPPNTLGIFSAFSSDDVGFRCHQGQLGSVSSPFPSFSGSSGSPTSPGNIDDGGLLDHYSICGTSGRIPSNAEIVALQIADMNKRTAPSSSQRQGSAESSAQSTTSKSECSDAACDKGESSPTEATNEHSHRFQMINGTG